MEVASGHEEIVRREEIRTVVGLLENSGAISRIVGQHKSGELDVIGRDGDGSGSIPRYGIMLVQNEKPEGGSSLVITENGVRIIRTTHASDTNGSTCLV